MDIIKRYPRAIVSTEVTLLEITPDTIAARHTAHVAFAPSRVVLGIGISTGLQFADKIVHPFLALHITSSRIDGHRRQIVSANMSVQTIPVRIRLALRR